MMDLESGKQRRRDPLPGARDLRDYFQKIDTTATAFARDNCLDRIQLMRVLNGNITRVSVDFADDIFRATRGFVKVHRFRHRRSRVPRVRATQPEAAIEVATGTEVAS